MREAAYVSAALKPFAPLQRAQDSVGIFSVQVRGLLEATAASASIKGWHGRHDPVVMHPSQRHLRRQHHRDPRSMHVPSALFAIPTANVWSKTELLLHSLAVVHDNLEVLVGPVSHVPTSADIHTPI